ncbi:MAG: hypothetical protein EON57_07370, partial [Alphaproteobacteria bacterium]
AKRIEEGLTQMMSSLATFPASAQLLLVSQFTLAADTRSGMRPSFTTAAPPAEAERGFSRLVETCREMHAAGVETGEFGAHMVVSLVNDGPVTFLIRP